MKKRILSTLLVLCMVLAMLPGTAWAADSGTCGSKATWKLEGSTLTISGSGGMYNYSNGNTPWYSQRASIQTVNVNGVSDIGNSAFQDCVSLTKVNIGNSVTSIGYYAFQGCVSLTELTIPGSVSEIEYYSFSKCSNLRNLTLRSGLNKIGKGAFSQCSSLTNVSIPAGVTSIGDEAFEECISLKTVSIPVGVTSIGYEAFANCRSLTGVTFPITVTTIGNSAFSGCSSMTSLTIPSNILSVGSYAFASCTGLTRLTIEDGVKSIGSYSFNKCSKLTSVVIPEAELSGDIFKECTGLTSAVFKDGSTKIPSAIFFGCKKLKSVTIPTSVTSIEAWAFYSCDALSDVYYVGTETQWNQINIAYYSADGTNSKLLLAKKHYNSTGTPSTPTPPATQTHTITLNANGGKVSPATLKVESGKTYYSSLPTPTRSGYKFTGWYTAKTGGAKITSTTKATANRTIYARWAKTRTYTVTFDANGGEVFLDYTSVANGTYYRNLPTPVYPGKHFAGWYTAKTGGVKITNTRKVNLSANQTLYARWSTAAVRATKTQSGSWKIAVPADCTLVLYSSSTSAAKASSISVGSAGRVLTCTSMATLSNGTVRYRTSLNGRNYWFCYSSEMSVN